MKKYKLEIAIMILLVIAIFIRCDKETPPPKIVTHEVKENKLCKISGSKQNSINYDRNRNDTLTLNWYTVTKCIIKKWEGFNSSSYLCSAKVKTVAWGITRPEIAEINKIYKRNFKFEDFLGKPAFGVGNDFIILCIDYRTNLYRRLYPHLEPNEIGTIVSLSFNVGDNAVLTSSLKDKLNIKDKKKRDKVVIPTILSFNKVGKTINKGLSNRREWEVKEWQKDISLMEYQALIKEVNNLNKM